MDVQRDQGKLTNWSFKAQEGGNAGRQVTTSLPLLVMELQLHRMKCPSVCLFQWYTPDACLQLKEHFHGQVSATCQRGNTGTVG